MTTYDPVAAQAKYRQFKTRLTRALNAKDWTKVLAEVKAFDEYYADSAEPMPDNWHRWQRAGDDARYQLERARRD